MESSEIRQKLEELYAYAEDAFRRKDLETIRDLMADDYRGETPDGKALDLEGTMESVRNLLGSSDVIGWDRRITDMKIDGERVAVTVSGLFQAVKQGESKEPVETMLVNQDVWQHTGAGW